MRGRRRPPPAELTEVLLSPDEAAEAERERVSVENFAAYRLAPGLAVCAVLDLVMAFGLVLDRSADGLDAAYGVDTSVLDVLAFVVARSLLAFAATAPGCHARAGEQVRLSACYWVGFTLFVLLVGKAIVFDWSTAGSSGGGVADAALAVALLLGAAELTLTNRLAKAWTRAAESSSVRPEGSLGAGGKKTLSRMALLNVLKPYFWPNGSMNKVRCGLTWVMLGISKGANLTSPLFIAKAVDALRDDPYGERHEVYKNIVLFCSLSLISKVFKELQNVIYLGVKQAAYAEIAQQTFAHLHSLSLEWHLKKKMGNILRSMDRGVAAADTVVSYLFLYLGPSVIECFIVFVLFYSHFDLPALAATAFVAFAAYTVSTVKITLWRKKFRQKTNKHDNDFHDKATDSLINFETVKYFTAEKFETDRYTDSIKKYQKYSVSTQASLSLLNGSQQLIIQVCAASCLCFAAYAVGDPAQPRFTIGDFTAVNVYILNLFAPLSFLGTIYGAVIQAAVDMQNLSELLAEEPDVEDMEGAVALTCDRAAGVDVRFEDVFFRYPSQALHGGLKGVSFTIEAGTATAVVGKTGAGKTSLVRLLFRFYDVTSGRVLVGGRDVCDVTQASLRGSIGVVPQDTVLFNDTIRHNLMYGRFGATHEELIEACCAAQIHEFIQQLPEGLDTHVGERGLKLSGGEKQRVAIARCLLKDPPVVVLDEATSALDSNTEASVQAALASLTNRRTTLSIAHRLSTIVTSEQIICLGDGRVLERGTHAELLAIEGGEYAGLWETQVAGTRELLAAEEEEKQQDVDDAK